MHKAFRIHKNENPIFSLHSSLFVKLPFYLEKF